METEGPGEGSRSWGFRPLLKRMLERGHWPDADNLNLSVFLYCLSTVFKGKMERFEWFWAEMKRLLILEKT